MYLAPGLRIFPESYNAITLICRESSLCSALELELLPLVLCNLITTAPNSTHMYNMQRIACDDVPSCLKMGHRNRQIKFLEYFFSSLNNLFNCPQNVQVNSCVCVHFSDGISET